MLHVMCYVSAYRVYQKGALSRRHLRDEKKSLLAFFKNAPSGLASTTVHHTTDSRGGRTAATVSTVPADPVIPAQTAAVDSSANVRPVPQVTDTEMSSDEGATADGYDTPVTGGTHSSDDAAVEDDYEAFWSGEDYDKYEYLSTTDDSADEFDAEPDIDVFKRQLAEAKVTHGIGRTAMNCILGILRQREPRLPKDCRTLVQPLRGIQLKSVAGGQYYHFGLEQQVKADRCNDVQLVNGMELQLQLNVDGLPLYKSKMSSVWPILGLLKNVEEAKVFPIGIFYGESKPNSIDAYLEEFLEEYERLNRDGFEVNDVRVTIGIHSVICDAPARAMVKCVKGHSGYSGCDKCHEDGVYKGRVVFPRLTARKRTDESFRLQRDKDHHHAVSPFLRVGLGNSLN